MRPSIARLMLLVLLGIPFSAAVVFPVIYADDLRGAVTTSPPDRSDRQRIARLERLVDLFQQVAKTQAEVLALYDERHRKLEKEHDALEKRVVKLEKHFSPAVIVSPSLPPKKRVLYKIPF